MRTLGLAIAISFGGCRVSGSDGPDAASEDPAADARPAGGPCSTDADCPADHLCEGKGCEGATGTCVSRSRMCTRDAQLYCGCDGAEFRASGSCPGRRFRSRGACGGSLDASASGTLPQ